MRAWISLIGNAARILMGFVLVAVAITIAATPMLHRFSSPSAELIGHHATIAVMSLIAGVVGLRMILR
jgi:hypothetical protein